MFFRNLVIFTLPEISRIDPDSLETLLNGHTLQPVGALAMQARGFVPPLGAEGALLQRIKNSLWLCLGSEDRGKRARSQIKQETLDELMPRAFVKLSRLNALIDLDCGVIAIDTASVKAAEAMLTELRKALGSLPALPLQPAQSPRTILTDFLLGQSLPEGWFLGEECELRDPSERGALVKCLRHDLSSEEVLSHLEAGKQVSRLAVMADGHVSCVIGEDLVLRKFKLLEGAVDSLESQSSESMEDELMARFALFSAEFSHFYRTLARAFGLAGEVEKAKAA
jgi:recombination associated protein RdgC